MGVAVLIMGKDRVAVYDSTSGLFLTDPNGLPPLILARILIKDKFFKKRFRTGHMMTEMDAIQYISGAMHVRDYRKKTQEDPIKVHYTEARDVKIAKDMEKVYEEHRWMVAR